ncbi:hypothetical protein, partial [Streptomyces sp. NPDC088360]|uniref:HEAT repeat domain-containing protein n=1 Tax=Streptomyces sp. NPDC088360 TaxID=3154515 RepID=UPI003450105F
MVFLEITSNVAGINVEEHRRLYRQAEVLWNAARQNRQSRLAKGSALQSRDSVESTVAVLQVQLQLERAQRAEDGLRWALSDSHLLLGTLLQIISALREIIVNLDVQLVQMVRATEEATSRKLAERQRSQAKSYKQSAEAQFDRVDQRRRMLEVLWDQAHSNVRRLKLHAEFPDITALPEGPALPSQQILPDGGLARPALVDIATALGKVQEHEDVEDQVARELKKIIISDSPLLPDGELAILLAATRLTDTENRRIALRALLKSWPSRLETRDVLVRLSRDEESSLRLVAAQALIDKWSGDVDARDALVALTRGGDANAREVAVLGLAKGWSGDVDARDALVALTRGGDANAREVAVLGLAK